MLRLIAKREGIDPDLALRRPPKRRVTSAWQPGSPRMTPPAFVAKPRLTSSSGVTTVSGAVGAAAKLLAIAGEDATALGERTDQEERDALLVSLGVGPGGAVPAALRSQVKTLEDDQKRRKTRTLRDAIDRIMVDVMSVLRDVVMVQVQAGVDPINISHGPAIDARAHATTPEMTVAALDAVREARERIAHNSPPLLVLEALLISLSPAVSGRV
jgi:DNA polymerase-3 subunit delta'